MKSYETSKLVKGEDMNHHDTLYGGRISEWFAEASFLAASHLYGKYGYGKYGETDHLVVVEVHSLKFLAPVYNGDILRFIATGIQAGKTSLTVYTKALKNNTEVKAAEGYVSFITIDEARKKIPHHIIIGEPETAEEKEALEKFRRLTNR
ncbi:MAG: hotdog domain-containing protein [Clostridia bacterium]|jgi:acyl-CoA hydrolase|nr:hotdog domain-containing protein [Clostridia bacterium]